MSRAGEPGPASGFAGTLREVGVVPVVTVDDATIAGDMVEALAAGGLAVIEITLRSSAGLAAIRATRGTPALVGAGTVTSAEAAAAAVDAGAAFVVSPGLDADTVRFCKQAGVPIIPGVATPTEVMAARALGIDTVKVFPAAQLGGPAYVRALSAVWPDQSFLPTGGVSAADALSYLELPSVVAVGGSWLAPAALQEARDWRAVRDLAVAAAALRSASS